MMRKLSYIILVLIVAAWLFLNYSDTPQAQATATSAGMADMGIYAAVAGFQLLAAFPIVTLAYLLNWQHLFKTVKVSKLRFFEAVLFLAIALVIAFAWLNTIYGANPFIQFLGMIGALPILIFGVVNLIGYLKLTSRVANTLRKVECSFFAIPALFIFLFIGLCFYNANISAKQEKIMAIKACEEAFVATVEHQINRQKEEIWQSSDLQHSKYYKNLPKRSFELFLFLSDTANANNNESYDALNKRINLKQAAWSLHIITSIDDAAPELVLTGLSDDEGFIQADLANYPQVRKALENGKTLRITTANGSGLLAAGKINNGEVLLRAIMDSFVPAKPMLNCP
jgi:hypothetical protein